MYIYNGVLIRKINESDIETMYLWEKSDKFRYFSGSNEIQDYNVYRKRFVNYINYGKESIYLFSIVVNNEVIGRIELGLVDFTNKSGAIGIVIGEEKNRNKGFGSIGLKLMLNFAFNELNLNRVYSEVYSFNIASQNLMKKIGFINEGTLRQCEYHFGKYIDKIVFSMLKNEFNINYYKLNKDIELINNNLSKSR
jgi:RimJ/RimL family protein N-acetyltransferase